MKASILIENLDNSQVIDEAIEFFEEGRRIHPKDSLNFHYWCISKIKIGENEKVIIELFEWLNRNLSLHINRELLDDFSIENLILIPQHWRNIGMYFETYDIREYETYFDKELKVMSFLEHFQISRAIFISMIDKEPNYKKLSKEYVKSCIQEAFYPLPLSIMGKMIAAPKDNAEQLSDQLSEVITKVATIHLVEISRCLGFLGGKSKIRPVKIEKLIDPDLYKELLLNTTEVLHTIFG